MFFFFFFQAEDGIRDLYVTGVQTCALPIWVAAGGVVQIVVAHALRPPRRFDAERRALGAAYDRLARLADGVLAGAAGTPAADAIATAAALVEIGRASCRERVEVSVVAVCVE